VDVGGALEDDLGGEEDEAAEGETGFLVGPEMRTAQRAFSCLVVLRTDWGSRGRLTIPAYPISSVSVRCGDEEPQTTNVPRFALSDETPEKILARLANHLPGPPPPPR
jgi:hypothetical protein